MADALVVHLEQFLNYYRKFCYSRARDEVALDAKVKMSESYDSLMNHLRHMMIGYETEEVLILFKDMERRKIGLKNVFFRRTGSVSCTFPCHEEIVMGRRLEYGLRPDPEILAWCDDQCKRLNKIIVICNQLCNIRYNSNVDLGEEAVLGFNDEVEFLLDQLTGNSAKSLQVISIAGMAGLGLERSETGSRVLFTSRDTDVSLHVQSARPAHVLRLRTEAESWDIFQKKIFRTGICPPLLENFGRVITRKCEGLPLAIVIAAGLLKNNWSNTWWCRIAASLSSFMVSNPSQYMDSLALSYNHLPSHLRPCFLYFGAFPEDYEIHMTKLIWLWIAHGFIDDTGNRILEDVAEDFLKDLVKRSLVMTPRIKADGQVKTCRIHDLLRDFTMRKAKEEKFMSNIYRYQRFSASLKDELLIKQLLMIFSRYGMVSSMLCSPLEMGKVLQEGGSVLAETYKLLRVLDMESLSVSVFPLDITRLVNLRYLAIQAHNGSPQESISNLVNLQMLIILSKKNVLLPKAIWNMANLRHLYIKSGENQIEETCSGQVIENDGCLKGLASLQTLSQVNPLSCANICLRAPNLRKLGFCGPLISRLGDMEFPNLSSLVHLQKLKLCNTFSHPELTRPCNPVMFPENLKIVTLSNTGIDWKEMWTFSFLPNLEILKLKFQACIGETWETGDAEFRRLKVLKLHDLNIMQWVSSKSNFPRLQHLVVQRCLKLNTIPRELGQIFTLEVIEVNGCNFSAYNSAMEIQKEQEGDGNCFLKVQTKILNRHYELSKVPRSLKRSRVFD